MNNFDNQIYQSQSSLGSLSNSKNETDVTDTTSTINPSTRSHHRYDYHEDSILNTLHIYGIKTAGLRDLLRNDVTKFSKTVIQRYHSTSDTTHGYRHPIESIKHECPAQSSHKIYDSVKQMKETYKDNDGSNEHKRITILDILLNRNSSDKLASKDIRVDVNDAVLPDCSDNALSTAVQSTAKSSEPEPTGTIVIETSLKNDETASTCNMVQESAEIQLKSPIIPVNTLFDASTQIDSTLFDSVPETPSKIPTEAIVNPDASETGQLINIPNEEVNESVDPLDGVQIAQVSEQKVDDSHESNSLIEVERGVVEGPIEIEDTLKESGGISDAGTENIPCTMEAPVQENAIHEDTDVPPALDTAFQNTSHENITAVTNAPSEEVTLPEVIGNLQDVVLVPEKEISNDDDLSTNGSPTTDKTLCDSSMEHVDDVAADDALMSNECNATEDAVDTALPLEIQYVTNSANSEIARLINDLEYFNANIDSIKNVTNLKDMDGNELAVLQEDINQFFDTVDYDSNLLHILYVANLSLQLFHSTYLDSDNCPEHSIDNVLDHVRSINNGVIHHIPGNAKVKEMYISMIDTLIAVLNKRSGDDRIEYFISSLLPIIYRGRAGIEDVHSKVVDLCKILSRDPRQSNELLYDIGNNVNVISGDNVASCTLLFLHCLEHILSTKMYDDPYPEFRNVIMKFVDSSLFNVDDDVRVSNFKGLKRLVENICANLKTPKIISTPFVVLELTRIFIEHNGTKETNVNIKSLCLRLISTISEHIMPIFHHINMNYNSLVKDYTKCFPSKNYSRFSMKVVDIELLDAKASKLNLTRNNKLGADDIKSYALTYINDLSAESTLSLLCHHVFYSLLKWHIFLTTPKEITECDSFVGLMKILYENTNGFEFKWNGALGYINSSLLRTGAFYCDAETEASWKLVLYHILNELYESIWRLMMNVLYSNNENKMLCPAITYLHDVIVDRYEYLSVPLIKDLITLCMNDFNGNVREQTIKIYFTYLTSGEVYNKNFICDVIDKILSCTKDLNYRVRLTSTNILHMYLSLLSTADSLDIVTSIAERMCDFAREDVSVRNAYINLLASCFFIFNTNDFLQSSNGKMDQDKIKVTERYVKIILYKMDAYKGKTNPIRLMLDNMKDNFNCIVNPISFFSKTNANNKLLKKDVDTYIDDVIERWLNALLDLFLINRSQGSTYHVLAEILCVTKLFGEVRPKLFMNHLVYFLPYLRIDSDTTLDYNRINIIILVSNLTSMVSGSIQGCKDDKMIRDMEDVDDNVSSFVKYDSPALTRAIIQLLCTNANIASYGYKKWVEPLFSSSIDQLTSIKGLLQKSKDVTTTSNPSVLKHAWQLACISEFVDFGTQRLKYKNIANLGEYIFELFIDLSILYNEAKIWGVTGMFIQCTARFIMNNANLKSIGIDKLKELLFKIHQYSFNNINIYNSSMMLLYQLLNEYQTSNESKGEFSSTLLIAINPFIRSFCSIISNVNTIGNYYYVVKASNTKVNTLDERCLDRQPSLTIQSRINNLCNTGDEVEVKDEKVNCKRKKTKLDSDISTECAVIAGNGLEDDIVDMKIDKILSMEIVSMIIINRLTNPELMIIFIFNNIITDDINIQRLSEYNMKLVIRQDADLFLTKLTTCFQKLLFGLIYNFFHPNDRSNNIPILGYIGELTPVRVQGILRIYLELIQSKRTCTQMFVSALVLQTRIVFDDDVGIKITKYIKSTVNAFPNITGPTGKREENKLISGILDKIASHNNRRDKDGCMRHYIKYFIALYVNLILTILDNITFNTKKDAQFAITRIQEVTKDNTHILNTDYSNIIKYRNRRLTQIINKLKRI